MIETVPKVGSSERDTALQEQLLEEAARHLLGMKQVLRLVLQQARARAATPETTRVGEAQYFLLHVLGEEGQLTAGDLAGHCHVADPTVSKMLNHLEAEGLVARRTDPTNRRVVLVTLTAAGRVMLGRVEAEWMGSLAQVLRPLTSAQLQDLIVALGHLERLVGADECASDALSSKKG